MKDLVPKGLLGRVTYAVLVGEKVVWKGNQEPKVKRENQSILIDGREEWSGEVSDISLLEIEKIPV